VKWLLLKAFWELALGFVVAWIGFVNFTEVHNMFLLTDLHMLFSFAFGLSLVVAYFLWVSQFKVEQQTRMMPGTIPGVMLFGVGWALTGGCPAVILVQLLHQRHPHLCRCEYRHDCLPPGSPALL
jgi:hypothetical protein